MTERNVAAEVIKGLQEVREHRAGRRKLRETRVEATPLSDLSPEMIARIRENLEGSQEDVSMVQQKFSQPAFKRCALCARSGELQVSHIIPGFVFDWLRETSATGHFRFSQSPNLRVQDGLKLRMLCWNCEQLFSTWESQFAEKCFVPINGNRTRKINYGPWMLKFATSVSWRVLSFLATSGGLTGFPDHILTKANDALQEWARFLLGHQSNLGSHEQHMFVVDVVASTSHDNPPPNISRYLSRTIDLDVAHDQNSVFSYAKMGRFVLFGFVGMKHPRRWKGTRLHLLQGWLGQRNIELPSEIGDYISARARFAAENSSQISERQRTKIRSSYERDLHRAAQSETLRAMHHDVAMFGTDAFEATQAKIRNGMKKNSE